MKVLFKLLLSYLFLVLTPYFGMTQNPVGWVEQYTSSSEKLKSVFFIDYMKGWATGHDGVIIHTVNGGGTWVMQSSGTLVELNSVFFIDANNGWAVGAPTTSVNATILHTSDGGDNWAALNVESQLPITFNAVHFINADKGWAAGDGGRVFHTSNGGVNWIMQGGVYNTTLGNSQIFYDVYFVDENNGWLSGSEGRIYATTDGGNTWTLQQTALTSHRFFGIHFSDVSNGWAAGGNGNGYGGLVHTTDGGTTWESQPYSSNGTFLRDVYFIDAQHGWVLGSMGNPKVFYTENGGADWNSLGDFILMGDFIFNSVHFVDKQNGWIACDGGRILHFHEEANSLIDVENNKYKITAYPNPFSRSITITFKLNGTKDVSLEVFDIKGEKISTLANGKLGAGVHSCFFEGESLPPGNYIYQLVIGDQVETGTLILTD